MSTQSFNGVAFADRPQPASVTRNGGPFNAISAQLASFDPTTRVLQFTPPSGVSPGDTLDVVLFMQDAPTSLRAVQQYSNAGGLFIGTTKVAAGLQMEENIIYSEAGVIPAGSPITQTSPALALGEIGEFETSTGVTCWGYRAEIQVTDFEYLTSAGGSAAPINRFDVEASCGGVSTYGQALSTQDGVGFAGGTVLLPEDLLTEAMLQEPRQSFVTPGLLVPFDAVVAGIYAIRS